MKIRWIAALAAAAGLMAAGHSASAQGLSSANYKIPSYVINSGGGTASSANYQLIASIGEPIIGPASSANYNLNAGFLATLLSTIGILGDINHDGVIDLNDVTMMLKIAGGQLKASDPTVDFPNGDINADGKVDLKDASKELRYVKGTDPSIP